MRLGWIAGCLVGWCAHNDVVLQWLWENEFSICDEKQKWSSSKTTCSSCFVDELIEEHISLKKNSKHVFALMVFNKQYLNVNYCDYFVWCAEVNCFSLLVMWRFIYSLTHKKKLSRINSIVRTKYNAMEYIYFVRKCLLSSKEINNEWPKNPLTKLNCQQ